MLSTVYGYTLNGITAIKISIEANVCNGAFFSMVGLPDNSVKESYQRILSALKNNEKPIPIKGITVNLAPADLRKEGSGYDLPISLALLIASGQVSDKNLSRTFIMGELSLGGELRAIRGVLPMLVQAKKDGFSCAILPKANLNEAKIVEGITIYAFEHIKEIFRFLAQSDVSNFITHNRNELDIKTPKKCYAADFNEVKGQEDVKRALLIAAAGGHNAILIGPPGSGKTMLSKRISGILPALSKEEALETIAVHSVSGINQTTEPLFIRPFRSPHHTISDVALVGGGTSPRPGEISLAHHGILFLDELPEFKRSVLEVLRQPLEDGKITISRSKINTEFPAQFILIASMNPCPCGYHGHPDILCSCSTVMISRYRKKISGPLLDRIDLHIEVNPVKIDELSSNIVSENSSEIRAKVESARNIQLARFKHLPNTLALNSRMQTREINLFCRLSLKGGSILKNAVKKLNLSARAYDRILKVARTIADLENSDEIKTSHISEAIQYRQLDRKL